MKNGMTKDGMTKRTVNHLLHPSRPAPHSFQLLPYINESQTTQLASLRTNAIAQICVICGALLTIILSAAVFSLFKVAEARQVAVPQSALVLVGVGVAMIAIAIVSTKWTLGRYRRRQAIRDYVRTHDELVV